MTPEPVTPESVATAVLGVDGVVAMSAGAAGQFRSYLSGGRSVPGVRIDRDRVAVNVVAGYGPSLPELAATVTAVLEPLIGARAVTVGVDDVVLPGERSPAAATSLVETGEPVTAGT